MLDTGSMMSGMKIMDSGMKIMDMGYTEQVGAGVTESDSFPITIEEDGTYAISYSVTGSPGTDGATSIRLQALTIVNISLSQQAAYSKYAEAASGRKLYPHV